MATCLDHVGPALPEQDHSQLQLPEHSEPILFHAWGRWFAVWEDRSEDSRHLPLPRRWEVVRIQSDPSRPEGIMLHEV